MTSRASLKTTLSEMFGSGIPSTKKFTGKTYYLFILADDKREALRGAGRLREKGYSARISAGKKTWGVYSNPKPPHWWSGFYLTERK